MSPEASLLHDSGRWSNLTKAILVPSYPFKSDNCIVYDNFETCPAFNRQFAAAGHIFEAVDNNGAPPTNNDHVFFNNDCASTPNHASVYFRASGLCC